jgi:hypothetical protein
VDISTGPGDGGMPLRIVIRRALALAQVIARAAQRGDTIVASASPMVVTGR